MALVAFPMDKPDDAITLSDGTWAVMDELHGRDYRTVMGANPKKPTPADVGALLELIEKRCLRSSVPDILDMPMTRIMELVERWMGGIQDDALPPTTPPGSPPPSAPRRSTSKAARSRASR
jgi:hypothetical protein